MSSVENYDKGREQKTSYGGQRQTEKERQRKNVDKHDINRISPRCFDSDCFIIIKLFKCK